MYSSSVERHRFRRSFIRLKSSGDVFRISLVHSGRLRGGTIPTVIREPPNDFIRPVNHRHPCSGWHTFLDDHRWMRRLLSLEETTSDRPPSAAFATVNQTAWVRCRYNQQAS